MEVHYFFDTFETTLKKQGRKKGGNFGSFSSIEHLPRKGKMVKLKQVKPFIDGKEVGIIIDGHF